jgi:CheY-like chemotaxis protein
MTLILVVDDEFAVAEVLRAMIEELGYEGRAFGGAREGLQAMARDRPDLVFTDTMMPAMDGPALVRTMASDPALASVPVVAMSALPESIMGRHYAAYAAFLRKPFDLATMAEVLRRLLPSG